MKTKALKLILSLALSTALFCTGCSYKSPLDSNQNVQLETANQDSTSPPEIEAQTFEEDYVDGDE